MIDPITDSDLTAFVDGQLDPMRRLDVEAHLAAHPEIAARVMADLHDRDALRASFAEPSEPAPARNLVLARRFDRARRWRRVASRLKRAAAIAVMVGAGWLAHDEIGRFGVPDTLASTGDPSLIAEARQARAVAQLRLSLAALDLPARDAAPAYDRARIRAATGISLPPLPEGWQVLDLQVFPARHGTGVEIAFDAGDLGEASLFATAGRTDGTVALVGSGDGTVLSWTSEDTAFALSGTLDDGTLRRAGASLGAGPAELR